jgi:hypothetical protein
MKIIPPPGIEFSVSMATNNETNIDTSSDVDQYFSSDGSVMSVDEISITEDGNSVLEADCQIHTIPNIYIDFIANFVQALLQSHPV